MVTPRWEYFDLYVSLLESGYVGCACIGPGAENCYIISLRCDIFTTLSNLGSYFDRAITGRPQCYHGSLECSADGEVV
jgi:hypothetical protein